MKKTHYIFPVEALVAMVAIAVAVESLRLTRRGGMRPRPHPIRHCPQGLYFTDGCVTCSCDPVTGQRKCENMIRCPREKVKCPMGRHYEDECRNHCTCYPDTGAIFCKERGPCNAVRRRQVWNGRPYPTVARPETARSSVTPITISSSSIATSSSTPTSTATTLTSSTASNLSDELVIEPALIIRKKGSTGMPLAKDPSSLLYLYQKQLTKAKASVKSQLALGSTAEATTMAHDSPWIFKSVHASSYRPPTFKAKVNMSRPRSPQGHFRNPTTTGKTPIVSSTTRRPIVTTTEFSLSTTPQTPRIRKTKRPRPISFTPPSTYGSASASTKKSILYPSTHIQSQKSPSSTLIKVASSGSPVILVAHSLAISDHTKSKLQANYRNQAEIKGLSSKTSFKVAPSPSSTTKTPPLSSKWASTVNYIQSTTTPKTTPSKWKHTPSFVTTTQKYPYVSINNYIYDTNGPPRVTTTMAPSYNFPPVNRLNNFHGQVKVTTNSPEQPLMSASTSNPAVVYHSSTRPPTENEDYRRNHFHKNTPRENYFVSSTQKPNPIAYHSSTTPGSVYISSSTSGPKHVTVISGGRNQIRRTQQTRRRTSPVTLKMYKQVTSSRSYQSTPRYEISSIGKSTVAYPETSTRRQYYKYPQTTLNYRNHVHPTIKAKHAIGGSFRHVTTRKPTKRPGSLLHHRHHFHHHHQHPHSPSSSTLDITAQVHNEVDKPIFIDHLVAQQQYPEIYNKESSMRKQYRLVLNNREKKPLFYAHGERVPLIVEKIAREFFKKPSIYVPKVSVSPSGARLHLKEVVYNHKEMIPPELVLDPEKPPMRVKFSSKAEQTMDDEWQEALKMAHMHQAMGNGFHEPSPPYSPPFEEYPRYQPQNTPLPYGPQTDPYEVHPVSPSYPTIEHVTESPSPSYSTTNPPNFNPHQYVRVIDHDHGSFGTSVRVHHHGSEDNVVASETSTSSDHHLFPHHPTHYDHDWKQPTPISPTYSTSIESPTSVFRDGYQVSSPIGESYPHTGGSIQEIIDNGREVEMEDEGPPLLEAFGPSGPAESSPEMSYEGDTINLDGYPPLSTYQREQPQPVISHYGPLTSVELDHEIPLGAHVYTSVPSSTPAYPHELSHHSSKTGADQEYLQETVEEIYNLKNNDWGQPAAPNEYPILGHQPSPRPLGYFEISSTAKPPHEHLASPVDNPNTEYEDYHPHTDYETPQSVRLNEQPDFDIPPEFESSYAYGAGHNGETILIDSIVKAPEVPQVSYPAPIPHYVDHKRGKGDGEIDVTKMIMTSDVSSVVPAQWHKVKEEAKHPAAASSDVDHRKILSQFFSQSSSKPVLRFEKVEEHPEGEQKMVPMEIKASALPPPGAVALKAISTPEVSRSSPKISVKGDSGILSIKIEEPSSTTSTTTAPPPKPKVMTFDEFFTGLWKTQRKRDDGTGTGSSITTREVEESPDALLETDGVAKIFKYHQVLENFEKKDEGKKKRLSHAVDKRENLGNSGKNQAPIAAKTVHEKAVGQSRVEHLKLSKTKEKVISTTVKYSQPKETVTEKYEQFLLNFWPSEVLNSDDDAIESIKVVEDNTKHSENHQERKEPENKEKRHDNTKKHSEDFENFYSDLWKQNGQTKVTTDIKPKTEEVKKPNPKNTFDEDIISKISQQLSMKSESSEEKTPGLSDFLTDFLSPPKTISNHLKKRENTKSDVLAEISRVSQKDESESVKNSEKFSKPDPVTKQERKLLIPEPSSDVVGGTSTESPEKSFKRELDWKSGLMGDICGKNPNSPLCLTYRSLCMLMGS